MLETRWNLMRRRLLVVLLPVLLAAGCDDFGFWPSSVPQVAGTYNGTLTLTFPPGSDTVTGSMSMVVVQDGERLTITGSMTLLGETVEIPPATGTLDRDGRFTVTAGGFAGIMSDPTCGTVTTTNSTWSFSGSTMQIDESSTTDSCGNVDVAATLTRA